VHCETDVQFGTCAKCLGVGHVGALHDGTDVSVLQQQDSACLSIKADLAAEQPQELAAVTIAYGLGHMTADSSQSNTKLWRSTCGRYSWLMYDSDLYCAC
jgi:hypothetical protein